MQQLRRGARPERGLVAGDDGVDGARHDAGRHHRIDDGAAQALTHRHGAPCRRSAALEHDGDCEGRRARLEIVPWNETVLESWLVLRSRRVFGSGRLTGRRVSRGRLAGRRRLVRPEAGFRRAARVGLWLGLAFAAQPSIYRAGLLFLAPAKYRGQATVIVDRIGETLERWLIAQIITMTAVFLVTWIGLAIIGIPSSFILGIQAGLLAFIPTVGAILGGLIVVLASLATGWIAALSAFILFLGVHALESYVLTPIIQRQALDIPPATLFAFQILLGVVFGIWGLALALPLMAIAKVMIDHFKADDPVPAKAV